MYPSVADCCDSVVTSATIPRNHSKLKLAKLVYFVQRPRMIACQFCPVVRLKRPNHKIGTVSTRLNFCAEAKKTVIVSVIHIGNFILVGLLQHAIMLVSVAE